MLAAGEGSEELDDEPERGEIVQAEVWLPCGSPMHTLHAVRGTVELRTANGAKPVPLTRGESALIPVSVGRYRLTTSDGDAEVVMVTIPPLPPPRKYVE